MLSDMYIAMMRGDTMSGKLSSGSYVSQIHDNITLVFEAAKAEGIPTENPCDKVMPPKMDARPKKAVPPDKARVIDSLDPSTPHELAWLIAATMGLRRGEVCGLSWGDVGFDRRVVSIRHSYNELGNLKGTKTKAGTRLLPLPDITARGGCSPPRGSRPSTPSASTSRGERRERSAPSGTSSRPTRRP